MSLVCMLLVLMPRGSSKACVPVNEWEGDTYGLLMPLCRSDEEDGYD